MKDTNNTLISPDVSKIHIALMGTFLVKTLENTTKPKIKDGKNIKT